MTTQTLDIIGTRWEFSQSESLPQPNVLGYMDAHNQTLHVRSDVFDEWKLYLLLHEVLHALTFLGHLQFLRDEAGLCDDEGKVDAIASLMAHFLKNNREVIDDLLRRE